jgi:hypothetical protein
MFYEALVNATRTTAQAIRMTTYISTDFDVLRGEIAPEGPLYNEKNHMPSVTRAFGETHVRNAPALGDHLLGKAAS